jgi:hypothetical protein
MKPLIDFIVDGKNFAMRDSWDVIPRVGDTVILKGGKLWVEVTRVIWGDDSRAEAARLDRQWVQLLCKTIPDPTKA